MTEKGGWPQIQDEMQFVAVRSFPPLGIDVPRSSSTPCRSACPNGIPQAAWGDVGELECVRNSAEEENARDERERSGENARFHSHWLEKMRLYGVVMCAGTCIRARAVAAAAGAEVFRYVCKDMLNADTYVEGEVAR